MTAPVEVTFLFDVDNTLLDNDRLQADLKRHLAKEFGAENRDRYWAIMEELRSELGYVDYLGAMQRYRLAHMNEPHLLLMSAYLMDYPFADLLYPGALSAIAYLRRWGRTVILSDGDVIFQPRKIQRSGLWQAVDGRVLIYVHKEQMLDAVAKRYPARHYVMVDDKLRILAAMKASWGDRLTTVFPRQGHYALDPKNIATYGPADIAVDRIGDLVGHDFSEQLTNPPSRNSEVAMNATTRLHELGQSLWLDNITRDLLNSGTLQRYCNELSVTGLTSNPTIFDEAIRNSTAYDGALHRKNSEGKTGERLFFELALEDLTQAAKLFRPIHEATSGVDGWVSLEVSPLLADDAAATVEAAKRLHGQARCPNLFIKIPGTPAGVEAIEEAIFAGVPVNVTLLFSREHYSAAADAYWRGIKRRIDAGLDPKIASVASIFVSRWDKVPAELRNRLGIAISGQIYKAYRERLASPEWRGLANAGALSQRLLWASTGTKDPQLPQSYYIEALAAPDTIDTMPEKALHAFAADGTVDSGMPEDGGDSEIVLAEFAKAGIDTAALARQLQLEGAQSFTKSWNDLMTVIASKSERMQASSGRGS
ncbi:transaldolase [Mesorhizobium sp. A556]